MNKIFSKCISYVGYTHTMSKYGIFFNNLGKKHQKNKISRLNLTYFLQQFAVKNKKVE